MTSRIYVSQMTPFTNNKLKSKRNLVKFFGADKDIRAITSLDADDWAAWLCSNEGLAENTIRKRCQFAKMFMSIAVKRKLILENPFADLVGTVVAVPERQFMIPRDSVDQLLEQCHGPEYRLLLIMARYMGLRVPSEIVPLKWIDVDWDKMRLVITSPKTKRHKGGDKRVCPIFPEVAHALNEAHDAAPEGAEWIFPSIRSGKKNLRTWLERAILRSGLTPWPRLWQNFRATRATELVDQFPSHVCAAWLGHTEKIADQHYRQVTSDHFDAAVNKPSGDIPGHGKVLAHKPSHTLAQKPSQQPHGLSGIGRQDHKKTPQNTGSCEVIPKDTNYKGGGHGTRTPSRNHLARQRLRTF